MNGYVLELGESELARYTRMAEMARRDESSLWASAGIEPGATIVDIGCGPGAVSAALAEVVGPEGHVIAVDQDPEAVALAGSLAAERGLTTVSVEQGKATATGVVPGSVDVAVIRHVLAHNGGREQAIIDHAASLVRPGGALLVVDVDLTAQRWVPGDADMTDLQDRYVALHRSRGNDPLVGLRLGQLLECAGLDVVEHRGWYTKFPATSTPPAWIARDAMLTAGIATVEDVDRWSAALERVTSGTTPSTIFVALFAACGRRATSGDSGSRGP